MKTLVVMMFLFSGVAFAQSNENITSVTCEKGNTIVEGTDELGATVVVVYDKHNVKTYQERILNNEVTYAKFKDGKAVEYGTVTRLSFNTNEPTASKK